MGNRESWLTYEDPYVQAMEQHSEVFRGEVYARGMVEIIDDISGLTMYRYDDKWESMRVNNPKWFSQEAVEAAAEVSIRAYMELAYIVT